MCMVVYDCVCVCVCMVVCVSECVLGCMSPSLFHNYTCVIFIPQMFTIYLKRAAEAFGVTHTREIYEKAIEILPDKGARYDYTLCRAASKDPLSYRIAGKLGGELNLAVWSSVFVTAK